MKKESLAVDVDEVLYPFVHAFSEWHNSNYGTALMQHDFFTYDFAQVLGVPKVESIRRIMNFMRTDYLHQGTLEDSQRSISALSKRYQVCAITARSPIVRRSTSRYLQNHFPQIGRVIMVGYYKKANRPKPKSSALRRLGAVGIIDDNNAHVLEALKLPGLRTAIQFGNYPWNKVEPGDLPEQATQCETWAEVCEHLL